MAFTNQSKNSATFTNDSRTSVGILYDDPAVLYDDSGVSYNGVGFGRQSKNSASYSNQSKN